MKTKVGINGFGRIGRNAFRVAFDRPDIDITGINDITDTKTLAYLLKHDTTYGAYHHEVSFDENNIIVEGIKIPISAEKDPKDIPWGNLGVEIVIESTGRFTTRETASAHLKAGAKKVIISAPVKSEDVTTIMIGANEDKLETCGDIISNASCTTNSAAAVMDVIDREYGIEKAMLTTVHSYTASQVLQDGPAKDLREGRAAAENIVPTSTGAATAVAQTVPNLKGKFDGLSIRVPTPVVSLSDITMILKRDTTKDELNEFFKVTAKEPYYQGILGVTEEELVSKDFVGNSFSGIIDLHLTNVVAGNMIKVVVWYDNEWGYSNRLVELVADVGKLMSGSKMSDISVTTVPKENKTEEKPDVPSNPTKPIEPVVSNTPNETVIPVKTLESTEPDIPETPNESTSPTNSASPVDSSPPTDSIETVVPVEPTAPFDFNSLKTTTEPNNATSDSNSAVNSPPNLSPSIVPPTNETQAPTLDESEPTNLPVTDNNEASVDSDTPKPPTT